WRQVPTGLHRRDRIVDATESDNRTLFIALTQRRLVTMQVPASGKTQPAAAPIAGGQLLAHLGHGTGDPLLLTRAAGAGGLLKLYNMNNGRWQPSAPPARVGIGPQLGGPVRDGQEIAVPIIQASGRQWPMRVGRLASGRLTVGAAVNVGAGSAQGLLEPGSRGAVAIWQQQGAARGRTFRTTIFVKSLAGNARPRVIWTGWDIGPGDVGIEHFAGHTWVLYTHAKPGHTSQALQVDVKAISNDL
ncbi:MAG TPA: hypothetical protein VNT03_18865, partial [Baekduia sp.]|nr:hypothetical protein [Baekduia sp.]